MTFTNVMYGSTSTFTDALGETITATSNLGHGNNGVFLDSQPERNGLLKHYKVNCHIPEGSMAVS